MRQAMIAAVQMIFQMFSGIFVLRFMIAAENKKEGDGPGIGIIPV